jgi:hypothetical protein
MVNTKNRVATNNTENIGESNNQEANPPPPPLLTLKHVLAMQAQMLQTMQQTLVTPWFLKRIEFLSLYIKVNNYLLHSCRCIFSWSDEVFLYFIVWVEVVEIQIWFEFKLICNLQNRFEKEKEFLNWKLASGWIRRGPADHRTRGLRIKPIIQNHVYPLSNFFRMFTRYSANFRSQVKNPSNLR